MEEAADSPSIPGYSAPREGASRAATAAFAIADRSAPVHTNNATTATAAADPAADLPPPTYNLVLEESIQVEAFQIADLQAEIMAKDFEITLRKRTVTRMKVAKQGLPKHGKTVKELKGERRGITGRMKSVRERTKVLLAKLREEEEKKKEEKREAEEASGEERTLREGDR
ncbi:hypothetical protein LTR37_020802 [Vermiconidia calcicola]|uniref:Uncharacterized protein n=1 Tax=Vermiconidia calcicola TaxID=1690605 RepID=A0ACC3MAC8_9PEZI|nr:hypothetical protein LTR37_020802 [Vermiconidia calcicola]